MTAQKPERPICLTEQQILRLKSAYIQELTLYQELLEKMAQKKAILIKGDVPALHTIDQALMALHAKIKKMEKAREAFQKECHIPDLSLRQLIERMEVFYVPEFIMLYQRLSRLAQDLQRYQRQHQDLIHLSLKWIQGTIQIYASLASPKGAAYTAEGDAKNRKIGTGLNGHGLPAMSTVETTA